MTTLPLPLLAHQHAALAAAGDAPEYALFMETGTGKTGTTLTRALNLFLSGRITQLLVIGPNGVHKDWVREHLPLWWPAAVPCQATWHAAANKASERRAVEALFAAKDNVFKLLTANIECVPFRAHFDLLCKFLKKAPTLLVLDESDLIKSASGRWTECLYALGKRAAMRQIQTGTDVTEGPFDLYSQFQFLKWGLLGHTTYSTFKARYAVWRERHAGSYVDARGQLKERVFPELVHYQNLDELRALIAPHCYRVLKKDCLDLPEQLWTRRTVALGAAQRRAYNEVKARVLAELEDGAVTTAHAFTKLTRLCQVTGGTIQYDDAAEPQFLTGADNGKLAALLQVIGGLPATTGVIIWARYVPELAGIHTALAQQLGGPAQLARYWGAGLKPAQRDQEAEEFKQGSRRIMIAQQHAGGRGHNWVRGTVVIYYSNDFSYQARKQSEDRAHRIGQAEKVTYIDLVAEGTTDVRILLALKAKRDVAEFFQGDARALITTETAS